MQLVEQHVLSRNDPRYAAIDEAAFKSKNLYNAALYVIRQKFIFEGIYLNYQTMDKLMQSHDAYKALPTKVSQQVLRLLDKNWIAFFEALEAYNAEPEKFTGRPKLPKYKQNRGEKYSHLHTSSARWGKRKWQRQGSLTARHDQTIGTADHCQNPPGAIDH